MKSQYLYIGTYTDGLSHGIYRCLVSEHGAFEDGVCVAEMENPSYLAVHESGHTLYAVSEGTNGRLAAFRIEPAGSLKKLNEVATGGAGPCFLSVSRAVAFVANYGGGSVASIPIREDGSLGQATSIIQHEGRSQHPERQEGPHPHCAVADPGGQYLLVPDLGTDEIVVYAIHGSTSSPLLRRHTSMRAPQGAGPRHLVFHPDQNVCFGISELNSVLSAYRFDAGEGRLVAVAKHTTLPLGLRVSSTAGHLACSPCGQFVYVSNRGHDSLAVLQWLPDELRFQAICHVASGGESPRHFLLLPDLNLLVVANRGSNQLESFILDETGKPASTGERLDVPSPTCLVRL